MPASESGQSSVESVPRTTIVVIHPGSHTLRIGRASDAIPHLLPHCIARRHKTKGQNTYCDPWLLRPECQHEDAKQLMRTGLKQAEEILLNRPTSLGDYRLSTSRKQVQAENATVQGRITDVMAPMRWTMTDHNTQYIVGEEALYLKPDDCYNIHWPMKKGRLNVHEGPGGSLTAIIMDLEIIWIAALQECLNIPLKDLKLYRAVVLIPDVFEHGHLKAIMTLLLERLGFGSAILHQESVCATFGAGITCACVVDVGDQKTNVCCVEDGISHAHTRIRLDYGGSDITRCLHWLLTRVQFPIHNLRLTNTVDALFLQELKEKCCHLDQDTEGTYTHHVQVKRPSEYIVKYSIRIGDEALLAPIALFFPEMFGLSGDHLTHRQHRGEGDPDDPHDDYYLRQTARSSREESSKSNKKSREASADPQIHTPEVSLSQFEDSQQPTVDDDADDIVDENPGSMDALAEDKGQDGVEVEEEEVEVVVEGDDVEIDLQLMGVDQAIIHSIEKCESDELKKKMYSCILVVGGGMKFAGAYSWLQHRIWTLMPPQARIGLEVMDVITKPKDMEPDMTCWKGATLLACLDTTQELWIHQKEWQQYSTKVLRERTPFIW